MLCWFFQTETSDLISVFCPERWHIPALAASQSLAGDTGGLGTVPCCQAPGHLRSVGRRCSKPRRLCKLHPSPAQSCGSSPALAAEQGLQGRVQPQATQGFPLPPPAVMHPHCTGKPGKGTRASWHPLHPSLAVNGRSRGAPTRPAWISISKAISHVILRE